MRRRGGKSHAARHALASAQLLGWALVWLALLPHPVFAQADDTPGTCESIAAEVTLGTLNGLVDSAPSPLEQRSQAGVSIKPPTSTALSASGRCVYVLQGGDYPDRLDAGAAELVSDGTVSAWGGVSLTITSLVENRTILVLADNAEYDPESGVARLDGAVELSISGEPLTVQCEELAYDPGMQRLDLAGLRLGVPLRELIDKQNLAGVEPSAELPGHFLGLPPETIWLLAGQAHFEQRAGAMALVLTGARFTHSSYPEPDLFASASEVIFNGDEVTLRGLALEISGIRMGSWPQYTIRADNERMYSFGLPAVNVTGDGIAWRQPVYFDFGHFKTDLQLDYSEDFDLLTHAYTYIAPAEGVELGVEYGGMALVDIRRVPYERHADYNFKYRQRLELPGWGVRRFELTGEYGDLTFKTPGSVREGVLPSQFSDKRAAGQAELEFELVPLGNGLYFTSGLGSKYIDYEDAGEDYSVLSGRAGLIYRQGRFDNFVLYKTNDDHGVPVFPTDAVRTQEIDFAASARSFPWLRHVVQGVYDIDREEFHTLQVSALKRMDSYEVGAYWDFVRDTAGFEIGLILD